jgi:hypothetical protein
VFPKDAIVFGHVTNVVESGLVGPYDTAGVDNRKKEESEG